MRLFSRILGRVVIAEAPVTPIVAQVPADVAMQPVREKVRLYVANVYCCNCEPSYHFDVAIPKGVKKEGCRARCPNCEIAGVINGYGQVWPLPRGRYGP